MDEDVGQAGRLVRQWYRNTSVADAKGERSDRIHASIVGEFL